MRCFGHNPAAVLAAMALAAVWPIIASAQTAASSPAGRRVVLDRVVAVVNGDVILDSDVREEMRFTDLQGGQLEAGKSARQGALDRLIDRFLILQQIKATQAQPAEPTAEEVARQISGLRRQIPQCAAQHCETEAGWRAFLKDRGLTEPEVEQHWRQRILILAFIQSRFGAGIRISQPEIEDYYRKNVAAEFARRKLPPPPLAEVSSRIEEILLQQHVNAFLLEWLQSLKDQGSVSILGDSDTAPAAPATAEMPGARP